MRSTAVRSVALSLLLPALACSDGPRDPVGPAADRPALAAGGGEAKSALDLIEQDYAGGLLDKNNANLYRAQAVYAPEKLPAKYRTGAIGKDASLSMVEMAKQWAELSASTQQQILDLEANGFGSMKLTHRTPHFELHYTLDGVSAVPSRDSDRDGTPDFIEIAGTSLEEIWAREVVQLGYPAPKGTPQQRFHIYFKELKYYGYCQPTNVELQAVSPVPLGNASAYIVVENDFRGFPPNDEDRTGLEEVRSGALKVTLAHEFMHAVQFNVNVYASGWLMESHATWAEDQVYDGINDWHWYVQRFLATPDLPVFSRFLYGAAFFQHYLSETYGIDTPRRIWNNARTMPLADAVRAGAFGATWEPITGFARAEYGMGISDFTTDAPSVVPDGTPLVRATHDAYPVSVSVPASTNKVANRAPWGLGANFIEFVPATPGDLTLTFDGTDGFAWRALVVATPANGRAPALVASVALDGSSAGAYTVPGFGTRYSKVTLIPVIADRAGVGVPFAYGATTSSATLASLR